MWVINKKPSYLMHYGVKGMTWDESKRVHDDSYYETLGTAKSQSETAKSRTAVIGKFGPKSQKSKKAAQQQQQQQQTKAQSLEKKERWWESHDWVKAARGQTEESASKVKNESMNSQITKGKVNVGLSTIDEIRKKK